MKIRNWPRLITAVLVGVGLAVLLGLQALSSVSTRDAPQLAVQLFPANGLAREQLAFKEFAAAVTEPGAEPQAARAAAGEARAAIRDDPLAPKAHAILALAQTDETSRRAIVEAAYTLNRRDLTLLGLVLQERLADQDYPAIIETLDQILRVHREFSREFLPLLASALAEEETIPLFAQMLDGSADWHGRFLAHAVGQKDILPNLAQLRRQISIADERFDSRLIAGLAASGDIDGARELVRSIRDSAVTSEKDGVLDWRSSYPPFEWRFLDQPGFRAQASADMEQLEIAVRPGKGGIIAARLLDAPEAPFAVYIKHRIAPVDQLRDVRLQLVCGENGQNFFDERFSDQGEAFEIDSVPSECEYIVLAINARAWSGRSALSGTIEEIEIGRR